MSTPFFSAALDYFRHGWASIPLTLDTSGFAKKPFTTGWQATPLDWNVISQLPWDRAKGIGLVLGAASDHLAAVDVDDQELANLVSGYVLDWWGDCRIVSTVRKHLHVVLREEEPSHPKTFFVAFEGREVGVELKAQGQQIAAPPTPGYDLACDAPPLSVASIVSFWAKLSRGLGLETTSPVYPSPWRSHVAVGERNNTAFIESCRLARAGMPLRLALQHMRIRYEMDFEKGDIRVADVDRTVKSAYRAVLSRKHWGGVPV